MIRDGIRHLPLHAAVAAGFAVGVSAALWIVGSLFAGIPEAPAPPPTVGRHVVAAGTPDGPGHRPGSTRARPVVLRAEPLDGVIAELARRDLLLPVEGVDPGRLADTFDDPRGGGRVHHAIDIMAERGTAVLAVEDARIARLDPDQPGGGVTIVLVDPDRRFAYYYAHLDRYADGLAEGAEVVRGQVLGTVGTTGNAPPDVPHLHFAIHRLDPGGGWWAGDPVNPYPLLK